MKKPYYLVSILKTKFFQTIVVLTLSIGGAYAQSGQKYSTSGNDLAAGDVIGSTNNQPLIFISNRTEAFRINPDGSAQFKQSVKLKGALQVTDFSGAGFRLLQADANGNIVLLNGTGSAGDVLLGSGTFGNFNNMADARITNFFGGNGNQLVLDNGSFIDITTFINTYAPSLNSYFTGAANQVVNGQGQFVDFSDMLEQGMHDFGLYYSNGNLGVGTATPGSTLDVSGDLTVHGQIFLVEGKTKSEQVETKEVITKTVEAEERITSLSLKSQALRSEVIEMDSQTKIVGETNVEGAVNVSETMTIGRLYAMEEEQPQQPTLPPAAPTFRLNVFGGTSITGNAYISNKLGLGVESPTEKLDVLGNAKLSGNMTIGGDLNLTNVSNATDASYNLVLSNSGAVLRMPIALPTQPAVGNPWALGGNYISDVNAQYLGTSNAADIVIKTNGAEQARIAYATGNTGFGAEPLSDYKFRIYTNEENKDGLHIRTRRAAGIQPVDESGDLETEMLRVTNQEYKAIAITNDLTPDAEPFVVFAEGSVKANNMNLDGVMRNKGTYVNGNINVSGGYFVNGLPATPWVTTSAGNINYTGNVGIANSAPQAKLDIYTPASTSTSKVIRISDGTTENFRVDNNGYVYAREVNVIVAGNNFPDYVFADGYKLMTPAELGNYFEKYKHLPKMPSAAEVGKKGMNLSELSILEIEKIEELSIYIVEQDKQLAEQKKQLAEQDQQLKQQQQQINELIKKLK